MSINEDYILEISSGLRSLEESEKRKLEFKSQWYDLSCNGRDIEEFCKDVTAIANTPGPDGYIIIGLNEANGALLNSPISESGLADETLIRNLLTKRVKPTIHFEIDTIRIQQEDNLIISIIKIPPSVEKPHVMGIYRKYRGGKITNETRNYVPIRQGTQIRPASHADYEYMYYDRKNIIDDYRLDFLPIQQTIAVNSSTRGTNRYITITLRFIVQNVGRHPVAISKAKLQIYNINPAIPLGESFHCTASEYLILERNTSSREYSIPLVPIIIPYNEMLDIRMKFWIDDVSNEGMNDPEFNDLLSRFRSMEHYSYFVSLESINNRIFSSEVWEV